MSGLFIKDGKAIVTDEGHWITVNGNHVLINEKGEVQAGLGGKFNGRRISKFGGKPTMEQLQKAKTDADAELKKKQDDAKAKRDEFFKLHRYNELKNQLNSDYGEIMPPAEKNKIRAKLRRIENKAREKFDSEVQEIDKAWNKQRNLRGATDPRFAEFKGKNNLVYRNLTAEKKNAIAQRNSTENSFNKRISGLERKKNETLKKYKDAAERVKRAGIGRSIGGYNDFANAIERRGNEKAQAIRQEQVNLEGRNAISRMKNMRKSREIHEKLLPAQETLFNARSKLKSAAEANKFIANAKGTRVSKATPNMLGGKFTNAQKEQKESYNRYRAEMNRADKEVKKASAERDKVYEELNKKEERLGKDLNKSIKYGQAAVRVGMLNPKYKKLSERLMERQNQKYKDYEEGRKESDVRANEADRKYREVYERNAERETKAGERHIANGYKIGRKLNEVKKALAKARPKIAERRQAIAKYNQATSPKTPSSKITTRFDKDYAKAEKSFEDFQDVMNRRQNEINVLQERLRTTKNGFIAKATKQDLDKAVREYNELDQMY